MQGLSTAQLTWVFKDVRQRRAERDLRALCIAGASQGGKPFELMLREIQRELRELRTEDRGRKTDEPESQMPLSAEDFAKMMREENT